jgi:hypothetical protein
LKENVETATLIYPDKLTIQQALTSIQNDSKFHYLWVDKVEPHRLQERFDLSIQCSSAAEKAIGRMSGTMAWSIYSKNYGASLHLDMSSGWITQHQGSKLWVMVSIDEARSNHIDEVAMYDSKANKFTWSSWLACPSFRWFILKPNQTAFLPANYLHATKTIGSATTHSTGRYCYPLPAIPHIIMAWLNAQGTQLVPTSFQTLGFSLLFVETISKLDKRSEAFRLLKQAIELVKPELKLPFNQPSDQPNRRKLRTSLRPVIIALLESVETRSQDS